MTMSTPILTTTELHYDPSWDDLQATLHVELVSEVTILKIPILPGWHGTKIHSTASLNLGVIESMTFEDENQSVELCPGSGIDLAFFGPDPASFEFGKGLLTMKIKRFRTESPCFVLTLWISALSAPAPKLPPCHHAVKSDKHGPFPAQLVDLGGIPDEDGMGLATFRAQPEVLRSMATMLSKWVEIHATICESDG